MAPEGEREHCLAAGMDEYLAKPFQASQLAAIVRAAAASTARPSSRAGVLEPSALENLRSSPSVDGESLFSRLVQIYEREAPESLRTMAQALDRGDTDAVEIAAHKLKGASANFGATQLKQLCQLAEDLCREGQLRFVRWLLPEIEKELEAVITALRQAT
jgi:HPt (histidine-containing phosphotransfer) domain-containing protein